MTTLRFGVLVLAASLAGCDYSGDFLFASVEGVDDVRILTGADGGDIVPVDIVTIDDVRANTIYAEVGPSLTTEYGGVTATFTGTGGEVCIWVDPETAYWSQAIGVRPTDDSRKWTYPDNVFDDGDIDLLAGLSVYYTGSPDEVIGDFVIAYEDALGNEVPISLASCPNIYGLRDDLASGGRGAPEYCTIPATDLGISYTILLRTWSTPLDDDRLAFGLLLANGSCSDLRGLAGGVSPSTDECFIQGESIIPVGTDIGPFYGFDDLNGAGRIWPRSLDFENEFCTANRMQGFCEDEFVALDGQCSWAIPPTSGGDTEDRCYCGDLNDTPDQGAF
ncbi:MAG: hypothetical protein ABMB14_01470 [Myxococcota bacterium]